MLAQSMTLSTSSSGMMSSGESSPVAGPPSRYQQDAARIATLLQHLSSPGLLVTVAQYPRYGPTRYLAGMDDVNRVLHNNIGAALGGAAGMALPASRVLYLSGPSTCGLQQAVEQYCETCGHSIALITYRSYTAVAVEAKAEFWSAVYELARLVRQCVVLITRLSERAPPEVASDILSAIMCGWFPMREAQTDVGARVWTVFDDAVSPAALSSGWRTTNVATAAWQTPAHADNVRAVASALANVLLADGLPAGALMEQYTPLIDRAISGRDQGAAASNRAVVVDVGTRADVDRFIDALLTARAVRCNYQPATIESPFDEADFAAAASACSRVVEAAPAFLMPAFEAEPFRQHRPAPPSDVSRHTRHSTSDIDMGLVHQ